MGPEGTYLNIRKLIYDKPTASIILNDEKLEAFPLRSETRQGCPLSPLLFNIILEVLAIAIKEKKKHRKSKLEKKLNCHFADDMILYIYDPKDATRKLLEFISEFGRVADYKINTQKSVALLYTNTEKSEREIQEAISFTFTSKRIKYLEINLPKGQKICSLKTIRC